MDGPTPTPTDSPPRVPRSRRSVRPPRRHASARHRPVSTSRSEDIESSPFLRTRRQRYQAVRPRSIPLTDFNVRHRRILRHSDFNLESGTDGNTASDYNSEPPLYHPSSLSSVDSYPFIHRRNRQLCTQGSSSSNEHRKARPKAERQLSGELSTDEDNIPSCLESGNLQSPDPLVSLDASPDKAAPKIRKMYLETKINMLEIIQAGLQLKLDMQCVREQFLSLLETYTYMEDNFLLRRPSSVPHKIPVTTDKKTLPPGRARVRALYDARRARLQARRARFAQELASGSCCTPVSSRHSPHGEERLLSEEPRLNSRGSRCSRVFTATSSEAMSDSTLDEWELKSVSSSDVLDSQDCSKHRHNNSPSSEGVVLTNSSTTSPDSDIPLGGAANSSGVGNSSTSSSDGTGLITKLTKSVTVDDKENSKPLSEDAKNNNLVNQNQDTQSQLSRISGGSGMSTSKLAPIKEEYQSGSNQSGSNSNSTMNHTMVTMQYDLKSFNNDDMDIDNDYVQITGIDPNIMDFNHHQDSCLFGGGEGMQSRISGMNMTQELPRHSQNSYYIPSSSFADTSIPIYTAKSKRDIGEYVFLASPVQDIGDYVTLKAPEANSMMSFFESNIEPSIMLEHNMTRPPWSVTSLNLTGTFGPSRIMSSSTQMAVDHSPKKDSPVKYATSESIRQLYTKTSPKSQKPMKSYHDRSLQDISNISKVSRRDLHETINDSTISTSLGFGSPEEYPLNSTMKSVLPQVHPISEDTDDTLENITDDMLDNARNHLSLDARTSFSEPSGVLRAPDATMLSISSPKSKDDSFIINSFQPEPEMMVQNSFNIKHYQPEDFITPTKKMPKKPQLCKEHGLHPTFGGPCIFEDSFDVLDSSTSSEDEAQNISPNKSKANKKSTQQTDTDCDSSYLSECADDASCSNNYVDQKQETRYTYDPRTARMKRQTGQTNIKRIKQAVGLSESDLHFNVTRKHLSLEATRSSLPDLANLSVPPSEYSEEQDSTLKSHEIAWLSPEEQGRPLSIATITTTTDESPEYVSGFPVPVNSPNVTDSSSSRPTTDNYDYVDIPQNAIPKSDIKMPPPRYIPPRRKPGVGCSNTGAVSCIPSKRPKEMGTYGGSMGSLQPKTHSISSTIRAPESEGGSSGDGLSHRSRPKHRAPRCLQANSSDLNSFVHGRHFEFSDNTGVRRTVVQHSAVARNLSKDRKKVLAKKLKQFSNFYNSAGNLQMKTLGHF